MIDLIGIFARPPH